MPGYVALPPLAIGCGTVALGASQGDFRALVAAAAEGPCHFDTAPLYAGGESETRLGDALTAIPRGAYTISTKTGRYPAPDGTGRGVIPSRFDYSRDGTRRSVEASLDLLGCERLDIVFVHDLDERQHGPAYAEQREEALKGVFPVLREMKADGIIGAVGVASMDWKACLDLVERAAPDIVMLSGAATLLDRESDPLFEACRRTGIQIIVASPFNSGILATGAVPGARYHYAAAPQDILARVAKMEAACARCDVPLAAAALQYPAIRHGVGALVVGHGSTREYTDNLNLLRMEIPQSLWDDLESL